MAIMGWDGFPFGWDTCRLGDGCMLQCPTVSLNTLNSSIYFTVFSFFFKKYFGSSYFPSFHLFGVLSVQGSFYSDDRFQQSLFPATSSPSVSRLSFPFYFIFLRLGCTSSSWGVKRSCLYPFFFISVGFCGEVECGIALRTLIPSLYGSRRG